MSEDYSETTSHERQPVRTDIPASQNAMADMKSYRQKKAVWRSYNTIWFLVGLINALLAFRFVFELLGANPSNAFVQLIYTLSYPFAGPFQTIFGITVAASVVFDWSLLVAIVVYLLIGYALIQLLRIIRPVTTDDVNHRINTI